MKNKNNASLKHGSYSILMVILVLAFLVAVNILVQKLPTSMTAYDMSDIQIYSIGDKTKEVVRSLDQDVTIYLVGQTGKEDLYLTQMLKLYDDLSSKVHVKNLDINRDFSIVKEYGLDSETIDNSSILVVSDGRMKFIPMKDIYEYDYAKMAKYSYQETFYNFDGEGEVTSALIYVTTKDVPKIYRVTGHEEVAMGSTITGTILKANYDIANINLMTNTIPEDCDILLINSPQLDYSSAECDVIRDYIDKGGKLFINVGFENYDTVNFKNLLIYCGIELKEGYIYEQSDHCPDPKNPHIFFENVSSSSALTKDLSQNSSAFISLASGLFTAETKKNTLSFTPFLQTSANSFQRVNYKTTNSITKNATDISGPITIGLTAQDSLTGMKMVVIGSNRMVTDASLALYPNTLNLDIFVSALNYLCSFDKGVSIPVKTMDYGSNVYMASTRNLALVITVILLPGIVLLIGFVVWYRRRNR